MEHSGRQLGGVPNIPARQEQIARLLTGWHSAFAPQGDGIHGVLGGSTGLTVNILNCSGYE